MNNLYENTICNPISLPNYAYAGRDWGFLEAFLPVTGRWKGDCETKMHVTVRPYRSLADPDIMYYNGKWYMYGSADVCYVTSDMVHWEAHALTPHRFSAEGLTKDGQALTEHDKRLFEIYGAVTVLPFQGKFYMVRSTTNAIYVSGSPFGPFEKLGNFIRPDGGELWVDDPALFEDDGRIYLYFGCGVETGIQGVELDAKNPKRLLCDPVRLIEFHPETGWECTGARHQDTDVGWIEGCDMFKHNGRYYLTYASNGTLYDSYNLGVYYSDTSPLSGFRQQKNGPFCEKKLGICRGSGHGCVTDGPCGSIWVFYTGVAASSHIYERRISMDKVCVNKDGELTVITTDYPQWAPGLKPANDPDNAAGIRALNHQNPAWASSAAPGRDPFYVADESMATWWQPDEGDDRRELIVNLRTNYTVYAARILWKEIGLDEECGIYSGPIQYKIDVSGAMEGEQWKTVLDMSENNEDYLNDYRTFVPTRGNLVKLTVTGVPKGVTIGVISFILFGKK